MPVFRKPHRSTKIISIIFIFFMVGRKMQAYVLVEVTRSIGNKPVDSDHVMRKMKVFSYVETGV